MPIAFTYYFPTFWHYMRVYYMKDETCKCALRGENFQSLELKTCKRANCEMKNIIDRVVAVQIRQMPRFPTVPLLSTSTKREPLSLLQTV